MGHSIPRGTPSTLPPSPHRPSSMNIATTPALDRRTLLRGGGASIALPFLGAMVPAFGKADAAPRRLVAIGNLLGFYLPEFFPRTPGPYETTRLLKPLEPHRKDFTLFSGLDHGVKGGHFAVHSFLTGILSMDAKGRPEGNISLDQRAAESVAGTTRFPSLTIGSEGGIHGGCQMCWTRSGTRVPPIPGPRELFRKLFVNDAPAVRAGAKDRFHLKGSILDSVQGDAKTLQRQLGKADREKLDEYFISIREVEQKLSLERKWANVDKPRAPISEPVNTNMVDDLPLLYDLIVLALQTGSTRIATLEIGGDFETRYFGIKKGYHSLSHNGKRQDNIDKLLTLEDYQMKHFGRFLGRLKDVQDANGRLLDSSSVLFGSGMSNANAHTNLNLPVIVAGGGYQHGQYKALKQRPLCNLYLKLLQDFGVETDHFGASTGSLDELF